MKDYKLNEDAVDKELKRWMEHEDKFENPGVPTIRVIGVDKIQHIAEPHKDTCLCGIKILRKKYLPTDYDLFSCYECTY